MTPEEYETCEHAEPYRPFCNDCIRELRTDLARLQAENEALRAAVEAIAGVDVETERRINGGGTGLMLVVGLANSTLRALKTPQVLDNSTPTPIAPQATEEKGKP